MFIKQVVFGAALALSASGCSTNESGHHNAKPGGDTSRPAERGSPVEPLREACGAKGAMMDVATGVIHRQPYLQQLTSSSAMVGWVSMAPEGENVVVTTVDGNPLMTAAAEPEKTAVREAGENQMWAPVTGLQPDTIYCYTITNGSQNLTERIGFRTPPAADTTRTVRVMAFGDSGGGGSDQYALLTQMFEYPHEVMIHTGDLAYDDGTIDQFENTVFDVYAELFRHIPFFPSSGNHEYRTMQGAPFRDVFNLPGDTGEKWYSYDFGPIHFVALDTEASYSTQAAWLDGDLAATTLPWKIVYFHRPPYSSGHHGSDIPLRNALEPVLQRHGVQLVLAGHDHHYERMVPQKGVAHVVTGGGGKGTRPVGNSSFTAFSDDVIHYVYLEVGTEELVLHAIDATGKEFDSMVVPRIR